MKFGFLREKSIFAAFKTQVSPEEIIAIIHEASADNISYKQDAPKKNSEVKIKGLMYQKIDKNTGKTKFKSGGNAL